MASGVLGAGTTLALQLYDLSDGPEADAGGVLAQNRGDAVVGYFDSGAAIGADQEQAVVVVAGMAAGDEGVAALDARHQANADQELQGAVDRRRIEPTAVVATENCHQVVG